MRIIERIQLGNTIFKLKEPMWIPKELGENTALLYILCELLGLEKEEIK